MAHLKHFAMLLACTVSSFVFLSWAMQTIWIASFPESDNSQLMVPFYLELTLGIGLAVCAIWLGWRWWRATRNKMS
jgi:membrane protein implicated in regulation of membrane protease activity